MNNNHKATALGILTSVCTALAVFDFDTMDWANPSTYMKMLVAALPAIGGYMSTLNGKGQ